MLKKILAMLLAFVMMLSLTACGVNKPTDNDAEPDDGKKQERVTEEPEENRGAGRTGRDGGTGRNRRTRRRAHRRAHRRARRGQRRFSRRYG